VEATRDDDISSFHAGHYGGVDTGAAIPRVDVLSRLAFTKGVE